MSVRFASLTISTILLTLASASAQPLRGATEYTLATSGGGDAIVRADTGEVLCRPTLGSQTCVIRLRRGETLRLLAQPAAARSFAIWQGPCAHENTQYSPQCVITGGGAPATLRAHFAPANEASAISSLRTLVSSQAMFYQGDLETEGTYDYATDLDEPGTVGMIDNVLGDGDEAGQTSESPSRPQRTGRRPPP